MNVDERIRLCRLVEEIENNKAYSERIGICNKSRFIERQGRSSRISGEDKISGKGQ